MKLSQFNYEATKKVITESIQNWIDFTENHIPYTEYFSHMTEINQKYLGHPMDFFTENNIDSKEFFKYYQYYQYKEIANDIINHIDDIHIKIIETFINPDLNSTIYPIKVMDWLYTFRDFCYNGKTENVTFNSLQKQNEALKKYPHFDASIKRLKCLNDYKIA